MENFFKLKFKNKKSVTGFTLVEMLVATTIFSIIVLGSISILGTAQKSYTRVSGNRQGIDNINMVMDVMVREMKFGSNYRCANTIGNFRDNTGVYSSLSPLGYDSVTCNAISFIPQGEPTKRIVYYFDSNPLRNSINQATYVQSGSLYTLLQDIPLTATGFKISYLNFRILGSNSGDFLQPKVEIRTSGVISTTKSKTGQVYSTNITSQTIVTQRILDNYIP